MACRMLLTRAGILLFLAAGVFLACGETDKGTGITSDEDFTLTLEVVDRFVHVGDQTPLVLRLRRTDNSNLQRNLQGVIVITVSSHGNVDLASITVSVGDDVTREFVRNLVFTAQQPGVAEVRATFLDASASVKVLISSVEI